MKRNCWHCDIPIARGKQHIRVLVYNPRMVGYEYVCRVVDSPMCAFCGKREANHVTSADDSVCRRCYLIFEAAIESEQE